MFEFSFEATGTVWKISFYDEVDLGSVQNIYNKCRDIVSDFESKYSRFLETSILYNLRYKTGIFDVGEEFVEILKIYFRFYKITNGKFTPLIGQVLEELGYDKSYSFKPKESPNLNIPKLAEAVEIISDTQIKINLPCSFDFGGVGKGYLIEKISTYLSNQSIGRFCVDGGGDMFYSKGKSEVLNSSQLRIGLENPLVEKEIIGTVGLSLNKSICSSSNNRRKWEVAGHIVNIDQLNCTGDGCDNVLAVWTVSNSVTIADAVSTNLFLIDIDVLKKEFDFEYLILYKNFSYKSSKNFNAELFLRKNYA